MRYLPTLFLIAISAAACETVEVDPVDLRPPSLKVSVWNPESVNATDRTGRTVSSPVDGRFEAGNRKDDEQIILVVVAEDPESGIAMLHGSALVTFACAIQGDQKITSVSQALPTIVSPDPPGTVAPTTAISSYTFSLEYLWAEGGCSELGGGGQRAGSISNVNIRYDARAENNAIPRLEAQPIYGSFSIRDGGVNLDQ